MKKERTVGIIMALIMSVAMGIVASVVIYLDPKTQTPSLPVFCLINLAESLVIGLIVAFLIPFDKMGKALAAKAKATPPSLKFVLLNSIPPAVGNSLIMSALLSFIGVYVAWIKIPKEAAPPLFAMWFGSWAPLLIPSILISYALSVLVSPIVVKAVMGRGRK